MAKQPTKKPKIAEYEDLGKLLENIYESGYANRGRVYKMSFFKGVVAGFGGVVGATIVVAILLWILSLLDFVPFVNKIQCTLENSSQASSQIEGCQKPDNSRE